MSNARQKKYYERNKKTLPKKYIDPKLFEYKKFPSGKFLLCDKTTGLRVIANPKVHGTEKWKVINGQKIYNGEVDKWDRAKMISTLKDYFKPYVEKLSPILKFPLHITYHFYDNFQNNPLLEKKDLDNHSYIYGKCFQDVLTSCGIIKDDSTEYVNKITYTYTESVDRKLVIIITHD